MAKLYFRYGAMGSSKTANALMVAYNYRERGKLPLLAKPKTDTREIGVMHSRIGLEQPCIAVEDLVVMPDDELKKYDCFIIDEAQFCKKSDIEFFIHLVDDLEIPVICYGLRADFQQNLFEGSKWLLAWADKIEEIKTVCWCGKGARCNARIDAKGRIIRAGEQVMVVQMKVTFLFAESISIRVRRKNSQNKNRRRLSPADFFYDEIGN